MLGDAERIRDAAEVGEVLPVGSGARSTSCLLPPKLIAIPYGIGSGRPWSPLAPDQQVVTRVSMAKALLSAGERPMKGVR